MSYANGTTHYNLPQTVGTDKRDWTDTNQAFADIDSAIHTAVETAETGATNIQALQTDVNALDTRVISAEADIATNTTDISLINTKINGIDVDIADVRQDAEDMICAYNEATATSSRAYAVGEYFIYNDVLYRVTVAIAIGGTIIPNTNCSATNVATELENSNKLSATEHAVGIDTNGDTIYERTFIASNLSATTIGDVEQYTLLSLNSVKRIISCAGNIDIGNTSPNMSGGQVLFNQIGFGSDLAVSYTSYLLKTSQNVCTAYARFSTTWIGSGTSIGCNITLRYTKL